MMEFFGHIFVGWLFNFWFINYIECITKFHTYCGIWYILKLHDELTPCYIILPKPNGPYMVECGIVRSAVGSV